MKARKYICLVFPGVENCDPLSVIANATFNNEIASNERKVPMNFITTFYGLDIYSNYFVKIPS